MFSTGAPGGTFDEVVKFADTYTLEVPRHPETHPVDQLYGKKHVFLVNHQECFLDVSYMKQLFFWRCGVSNGELT